MKKRCSPARPSITEAGLPSSDPSQARRAEDSPVYRRFADRRADGCKKPADEYDPAPWDLRGVEEDVRIRFETGRRLAEDDRYPNGRYASSFRPVRDAMRAR